MTQNTTKQTISSAQQTLGNTTEYHTDKEHPKPKTPYPPQHDQERAYQAFLIVEIHDPNPKCNENTINNARQTQGKVAQLNTAQYQTNKEHPKPMMSNRPPPGFVNC